jgi:glycosyltransferase involved in cell wall biosynthesis
VKNSTRDAQPERRLRVLVVLQGSGGGIGRIERLLIEMLRELRARGRLEFELLARELVSANLQSLRRPSGRPPTSKAAFALRALARFVLWRPDIVIFTHVNHAPIALAMRRLRPSTRQVVLVYGWDVWFGLSRLKQSALREAEAIWSISDYTTDQLVQITGIPLERVKLLVPGLTAAQADAFITPLTRADRDGNEPWLLSVARLDAGERQKGIDHVLNAMYELRTKLPQVRYRIVGDGSDRARLEGIARDLGIDDRVEFLGHIDFPELAELYKSCEVFILPSAQEGFGLVYVEAMAAGKPVIAAQAGAVPEVVVDGQTGLLVEYGNETAIADAIARLCAAPELGRRLGSAGRERFLERFSFERVKARFDELLGEVVATSRESVPKRGI